MKTLVHVAVGVITNGGAELLIARRPDHLHQGGLWEFPGGKVEPGESVEVALQRELEEELAIRASLDGLNPLMKVTHAYSDKSVLLDVWWVKKISGEPRGLEGQEVRWVHISELGNFDFPAANGAIVQRILQELSDDSVSPSISPESRSS